MMHPQWWYEAILQDVSVFEGRPLESVARVGASVFFRRYGKTKIVFAVSSISPRYFYCVPMSIARRLLKTMRQEFNSLKRSSNSNDLERAFELGQGRMVIIKEEAPLQSPPRASGEGVRVG